MLRVNGCRVHGTAAAYLEFETELQLLEPQHFRDVVDKLLGVQPKVGNTSTGDSTTQQNR